MVILGRHVRTATLVLIGGVSIGWIFRKRLQQWKTILFDLGREINSEATAQDATQSDKKSQSSEAYSLREAEDEYEETPSKVSVFFASQTGTAESLARQLHQLISKKFAVKVQVDDVENLEPLSMIDIAQEKGHWIVFCVATYGEGEPTDSAKHLFRWVRSKKRDRDCLNGLRYGIMGLGNSQYELFNQAAKFLDKHLMRLGAIPFCSYGEADDDDDVEIGFTAWIHKEFLPSLAYATKKQLLINDDGLPHNWTDLQLDSIIRISRFCETLSNDKQIAFTSSNLIGRMYFNCFYLRVVESYELYQKPDLLLGKTTKHIEVDLSSAIPLNPFPCPNPSSSLSYKTGDTIEILPSQSLYLVQWIFNRLTINPNTNKHPLSHITLNTLLLFQPDPIDAVPKCPFPSGFSIGYILQYFCDLSACPTREVLRNLSSFVKSPDERRNLARLLEDGQVEHFTRLVRKPMLTLKESLELLMSSAVFCETEKDFLAAILVLPRLAARSYTISSSSLECPNTASMTVSLVTHRVSFISVCYLSWLNIAMCVSRIFSQSKILKHCSSHPDINVVLSHLLTLYLLKTYPLELATFEVCALHIYAPTR